MVSIRQLVRCEFLLGDLWEGSHLHSFCNDLQSLSARSRDIIELGGPYLWTAMVTAKDDNVVSSHFEALPGREIVEK